MTALTPELLTQQEKVVLFKVCFKCGVSKPLSGFYLHKEMADGHLNKCKQCQKDDVAAHREANISKIRAYDKERSATWKREQCVKHAKVWEKNHKKERNVQQVLRRAVASGKIVKLPCEICGAAKAEAHHSDYDNPLAVTWLCRPHHAQAHALFRKLIKDLECQNQQ